MQYPILIVGAGAAGIGMGVLLKRLGLSFLIIEQDDIGASFSHWAEETRFISPSFSGNAFGSVDLNAITPDTSPAFTLRTEHPTGKGYATYLKATAGHFKLPIKMGVTVQSIQHDETADYPFSLTTSVGEMQAQYVIWAAGEYQYPNRRGFDGADLCIHYADVASWTELDGDEFNVIGGYESGVDAAFQLARLRKKVRLFDANERLSKHGSDSSYTLSPFTRDRFNILADYIEVVDATIKHVDRSFEYFELFDTSGERYSSPTPPINCTGFDSSLTLVKSFFEVEEGSVKLTSCDESTRCPNLFLVGPQVKHGGALFCFIYKFRQRFAIIGEVLSERLDGDSTVRDEIIEYYKKNQFYLSDLSCCDDECVC